MANMYLSAAMSAIQPQGSTQMSRYLPGTLTKASLDREEATKKAALDREEATKKAALVAVKAPSAAGAIKGSALAPKSAAPGNVSQWLQEALQLTGQDASLLPYLETIVMKESSGNPLAINDWDSNAKAGTPSKGLMQTIDSTFEAHKVVGHDDIWNPVDNAAAAIRYAISRYGSLDQVPGIKAMAGGGNYVGY